MISRSKRNRNKPEKPRSVVLPFQTIAQLKHLLGQRLQRVALAIVKPLLAAALQLLERVGIELVRQSMQLLVQLVNAEEDPLVIEMEKDLLRLEMVADRF